MLNSKEYKICIILSIVRIIFLIIISIIIGINIYLWNSSKMLGDAMPMPSGYGVAVVLSGSMEPNLAIDDLIIVKKMADYNVGDIVVYQRNYELIVHRIVAIEDNLIITKGDANSANDKAILKENIKGKVINNIPNIGKLVDAVKSPTGIMLILGITISLYIYSSQKDKKFKRQKIIEIEHEIKKLK